MKELFLNSSINLIKKSNNYKEEDIEIIRYGLEGLYLTITKGIVILGLALILGILREVIFLLISYNVLRSQAFGIHATKSIYCLISSVVIFIGGAYLAKVVVIPFYVMVVICILGIILLYLYAPSDTEKRPIVNKKKRMRFKYLSTGIGVIYFILIIIFRSNYLLFGLVIEVVMILPITYKIFKMPYNNYKNYSGV